MSLCCASVSSRVKIVALPLEVLARVKGGLAGNGIGARPGPQGVLETAGGGACQAEVACRFPGSLAKVPFHSHPVLPCSPAPHSEWWAMPGPILQLGKLRLKDPAQGLSLIV